MHGPRGVGKQRLALWLAQLLLCENPGEAPCEKCASCKHVRDLRHPDLHWFFPRPRPKDADLDAESVRDDIAEALEERREASGIYPPASGSEGIFIATVRSLVRSASLTPALAKRKVFIVGDADRMVSQEGADQAANAFLKLLEEPPADTTIIITSSEPGALLQTVRSRVAPVRVAPLTEKDLREFLEDPAVQEHLSDDSSPAERIRIAAGAPGRLFAGEGPARAMTNAKKMLAAATSGADSALYATSMMQGTAGARGAFSDTLDSLVVVLNERVRDAIHKQDELLAIRTARAIHAVARAQTQADGNVNPQLISAKLLRDLRVALR